MTRTLLTGAAALGLAMAAPDMAKAQIPVTDALANSQLAQQVAHALGTLRQMEMQYRQLQATYNVLAHTTSVSALAGRLGATANGLGASEMGAALSGARGVAGSAQQMTNLRAFSSSGDDWSAREMTRKAQRLSNIRAVALQQMRVSEQRIAGLRELMNEADTQPDIQASAALNNRIQAEHALLTAQQQQLAQLQMIARTEEQADLLRAEERQRQSAEQWRDTLQPLGDE
ncbi:MAG TPA: type IV secretion system protein [Roseomonas sp.]|nr:type IV secretion system protein [Roseomonas sp.]